jgi:hypothetical protein
MRSLRLFDIWIFLILFGVTISCAAKIVDPKPQCRDYCMHENIQITEFWVGEPIGGGSTEDNNLSCWDDDWREHYGCYDDPYCRKDHYPCCCIPKENPFYVCVPYEKITGKDGVVMKNRWVEINFNDKTAYAQVEDCGPYVYDDWRYVFECEKPKNKRANGTGMDVSPATWGYLGFQKPNTDDPRNKVDWKFIDFECVPDGPWKKIITTRGVN